MTSGNGQLQFAGIPGASFAQRLASDYVEEPALTGRRERLAALSRSVRDLLAPRWLATSRSHDRQNPKQVYYLSMRYLLGRSLAGNVASLRIEPMVRDAMRAAGIDWRRLADAEDDAGLGAGPGALLAASILESLATLQVPATGYGLRYEYGPFRQEIEEGRQIERPANWLRLGDPWEVARPAESVEVKLAASFAIEGGRLAVAPGRAATLVGVPYDRPVVGFEGRTINTLRLWSAAAPDRFDPDEFRHGDFFGAVHDKIAADALTRVLYPDDGADAGRGMKFVQEYFLVACSTADLLARFQRRGNPWSVLPDKAAVQMNGAPLALAVVELMRRLIDEHRLEWDEAWRLTVGALGYTNQRLTPLAMEAWPISLFEVFLPRGLEIIDEINRRFLAGVRRTHNDESLVQRVSLFQEPDAGGGEKKIRLAHLAVVGAHATNGISSAHSRLLAERLMPDLVALFPERFHSESGGVSPRRWLLQANPPLARLLTETLGEGWIADLDQLRKIVPLAEDPAFRAAVRKAARDAKASLCDVAGQRLDPDSIFQTHARPIAEQNRQLLALLHIATLYARLREPPPARGAAQAPPRTFLFAGKAAPGDALAKLTIKLIHNLAAALDADPLARGRLAVRFLPDWSLSLAERLIPATDVCHLLAPAGSLAGGSSGMKFMMNGALLVSTRDGAALEIAEEAGEGNVLFFGLTAAEADNSRSWYSPQWHYHNEPAVRSAVDLLFSDEISPGEPGLFSPLRDRLLNQGDPSRCLADLTSYTQAEASAADLWSQPDEWARLAVINIGRCGKFSSDRAVARYARDIWNVGPCPVE